MQRTVHLLVFATLFASAQCSLAAEPPEAGVQCNSAQGWGAPFAAGKDRCWAPINGKTIVPTATLACAVNRQDGSLSSVTFIFSETQKIECSNGKPATKEQVALVIKKLSAKEQAFYAAHSATR